MRPTSLALILLLAASTAAMAAPAKKKSQSPPTAQPDATLVAPDTTTPPPTFAVATRTVEMEPIGSTGAAATKAAAPVVQPTPATLLSAPTPAAAPAPPATSPAPTLPPAPPEPPVVAHAEVCLRAEAPRAAKAEMSAKLAVDLLLEDLCGAEVDRAALYAHNLDALAHFTPQSERASAGLSGARVDPETGEIVNPPAGDVTAALAASGVDRTIDIPPQMRRFAAELVLQVRSEAAGRPAEAHKAH